MYVCDVCMYVYVCTHEYNLYFHKIPPPSNFSFPLLKNILHFRRAPPPFSPPTPPPPLLTLPFEPLLLHLLLAHKTPTLPLNASPNSSPEKSSHWHHISLFISIPPSADFHLLRLLWSIKSVRCSSLRGEEEEEEEERGVRVVRREA